MDIQEKLGNGQLEERLNGQGVPEYIVKTDADLKQMALAVKAHLEAQRFIAHDFTSLVWNSSETESATFKYQSDWPLDGLGEGELE